MSRLLRFFPPVVTGTIIAIIGISLMRVGIGWAMGGPAPTAQSVDVPKLVAMVDAAKARAAETAASLPPGASAPEMKLPGPVPMKDNPNYGAARQHGVAAFVLVVILLLVRYGRGFVANISVLLGIVAGCVVAAAHGQDALRQGGQGPLVGRRHALRLRHAHLRPGDGADHDPGDDRGDDRIHRHVPGAVRHHRPQDQPA
jgi:xanthine/uracil permease